MVEKKSFLVYHDYAEQIGVLSNEEAGILFKAMLDYSTKGILPSFDGAIGMAFLFIKATIDRDREKYVKACLRNSRNGKAGGRPRRNLTNDDTLSSENEHTAPIIDDTFIAENDIPLSHYPQYES